MFGLSRNAFGVLVLAVLVFSDKIKDSDKGRDVVSLEEKDDHVDIIVEDGVVDQARDKRTIGFLLGGVADLFGYDLQRRPPLVPQQNALGPDPSLARQTAPSAPPPPPPPPAPAPPAPAPAPPAPPPPPGIPPPLQAPVTLTDGVRRAFQVGVNWSNQRQQLGGPPPAPAAAPPPPAPAAPPAPAPAAPPAPAPAAPPPPAAAPPPPPPPPPAPPIQGERRSVSLGLNWQNLRQLLGGPPPAPGPAVAPPAAAPAGPPPAQGVRQSYQIGLDFANQRQQLGGPPPPPAAGPPPPAGPPPAAPPPAAAPPPPPPPLPPVNAPIANLGFPIVRPLLSRVPELFREKPLLPTVVERIYFNKDKPLHKNIYYQKELSDKFKSSPPLVNKIANGEFRTTTVSAIPYALGEHRLPPRLDTPPREIRDDLEDEEEEPEEDDYEDREESRESRKEYPRGFEKKPLTKIYKVETNNPKEKTYVFEEDYTYGNTPKQYTMDLPGNSKKLHNTKKEVLEESKKRNTFSQSLKTTANASKKKSNSILNPTPLTLFPELPDLKNNRPLEIKFHDGEFKTLQHHRSVRSLDTSTLIHQTPSATPSLTRSYLVNYDSQPAENIVSAKSINKNIINYYENKFKNDAAAARNAIQNAHLITEPYYVLSPEQYQDPYSVVFKEEDKLAKTIAVTKREPEIVTPTPEITQLTLTNTPVATDRQDGDVNKYHQNALKSIINTFEDLSQNPDVTKPKTTVLDDVVNHYHQKALNSLIKTFTRLSNPNNQGPQKTEIGQNQANLDFEDDNKEILHKHKVLELVKETDKVIKNVEEQIGPLIEVAEKTREDIQSDELVKKHQEKILKLKTEADDIIKSSNEEKNNNKVDTKETLELVSPQAITVQDSGENSEDNDGEIHVGNEGILGPNDDLDEKEENVNNDDDIELNDTAKGPKGEILSNELVKKHQEKILELKTEADDIVRSSNENINKHNNINIEETYKLGNPENSLVEDSNENKDNDENNEKIQVETEGIKQQEPINDFERNEPNKKQTKLQNDDIRDLFDYNYFTRPFDFGGDLAKEIEEIVHPVNNKIPETDKMPAKDITQNESDDEDALYNKDASENADEDEETSSDEESQEKVINNSEEAEVNKKIEVSNRNQEENGQHTTNKENDNENENTVKETENKGEDVLVSDKERIKAEDEKGKANAITETQKEVVNNAFDLNYYAKPYAFGEELAKIIEEKVYGNVPEHTQPNQDAKKNVFYNKQEDIEDTDKETHNKTVNNENEENEDKDEDVNQKTEKYDDQIKNRDKEDTENPKSVNEEVNTQEASNADKENKESDDENEESDDENEESDDENEESDDENEENDDEIKKSDDEIKESDDVIEESDNKNKENNNKNELQKTEGIKKDEEIVKLRAEEEQRRKLEENEKQNNEYINEHFEVDIINGLRIPTAIKDTDRYNKIITNSKKSNIDQFALFPHHEYQFKELDSFFGKEFDENLRQLDRVKNKVEEQNNYEREENDKEDTEAENEEETDEDDKHGGKTNIDVDNKEKTDKSVKNEEETDEDNKNEEEATDENVENKEETDENVENKEETDDVENEEETNEDNENEDETNVDGSIKVNTDEHVENKEETDDDVENEEETDDDVENEEKSDEDNENEEERTTDVDNKVKTDGNKEKIDDDVENEEEAENVKSDFRIHLKDTSIKQADGKSNKKEEGNKESTKNNVKLLTQHKSNDLINLQYPHEKKSKEIYGGFKQELYKITGENPDTQDSITHEVVQPPLHSGGFKSGDIEIFDNSQKVVPVPYDYDYSGSEKKKIVSKHSSFQNGNLRTKRNVLDPSNPTKKVIKREDNGYTWSYVPEKYDSSFTYEIPEPVIPNLKRLEAKEYKEDEKLSPSAIVTESESGRMKTYIRVNEKETQRYS